MNKGDANVHSHPFGPKLIDSGTKITVIWNSLIIWKKRCNGKLMANLVEVYIIIKRQCPCSPCISQPGNGVSAYWQEDNCHVQLQGFSSTFCSCHAVAHHIKDIPVAILHELPCEQSGHYRNPQCKHPQAFPIILQVVTQCGAYFANWTLFP